MAKTDNVQSTKDVNQLLKEYGIEPRQPIKAKKLLNLQQWGKTERIQGFGMFDWEFEEEYYFAYNNILYVLSKNKKWRKQFLEDAEYDEKYVVPLSAVSIVPNPKPWSTPKTNGAPIEYSQKASETATGKEQYDYEANDKPFGTMTLRQYACIHSGVPDTGIDWLDEIITKNSITR